MFSLHAFQCAEPPLRTCMHHTCTSQNIMPLHYRAARGGALNADCVRSCVPVSASEHGKPSTYAQQHESLRTGTAREHGSLRTGTAREHDLLHLHLLRRLNLGLQGCRSPHFTCEAKIVRVQVYPWDAQCWHDSKKASAGTFVTGNRFGEFDPCSLRKPQQELS